MLKRTFIFVAGASSVCTHQGANLFSRFCGVYLSTDTVSTMLDNVPICGNPRKEDRHYTNYKLQILLMKCMARQ
jgi:hypothetical protein